MKFVFILLSFIALNSFAQDPKSYLAAFDNKIYSLKSRGVKDFVVDIESSRLTRQMNDLMVFGEVKKLVFRTYWTANPERIDVEIIGLPDGFKEIKEELKVSVMSMLDNLIPVPTADRFAGYNITGGSNGKEFIATDKTGIAPISSYVLKFDDRDMLAEVIGKKTIGNFTVESKYEKPSFANGKWVLLTQKTTTSESGQTLTSMKELSYGTSQGMSVLSRIDVKTQQSWSNPEMKPLVMEESLEFKNYKIDNGEALKYFLGDATKK